MGNNGTSAVRSMSLPTAAALTAGERERESVCVYIYIYVCVTEWGNTVRVVSLPTAAALTAGYTCVFVWEHQLKIDAFALTAVG